MGRGNKLSFGSFGIFSLAILFSVSAAIVPSNILARSSVETSSPEEKNEVSLSGFQPLTTQPTTPSVDFSPAKQIRVKGIASPILAEVSLPSNPVEAVLAAAIVLAYMSIKESGKVDLSGIYYILNSTDYYAGIVGAMMGGGAQKGASAFLRYGARKALPNIDESLQAGAATSVRSFLAFGNIINGITYTASISSNYEYWSQVWKYATRNIPTAHRMSDFWNSPLARKKQVFADVLYYTSVDTNMRNRIMQSVFKNRIMTYQFIAMNIGMYVGGALTNFIIGHYGIKSPLLNYVAPMLGSAMGGVLASLVPAAIQSRIDNHLLDIKIKWEQDDVEKALEQLEYGVQNHSYFNGDPNFQSNIDTLFEHRDILLNLELQESVAHHDNEQNFKKDSHDLLDVIQNRIEVLRKEIEKSSPDSLMDAPDWEGVSTPQSLEEYMAVHQQAPAAQFYKAMLIMARDRNQERTKELDELQDYFFRDPNLPASSDIFILDDN